MLDGSFCRACCCRAWSCFGQAKLKLVQVNESAMGRQGGGDAIAIDPQTPATLYAGFSDLGLGGGVFKSSNGGGRWVCSAQKKTVGLGRLVGAWLPVRSPLRSIATRVAFEQTSSLHFPWEPNLNRRYLQAGITRGKPRITDTNGSRHWQSVMGHSRRSANKDSPSNAKGGRAVADRQGVVPVKNKPVRSRRRQPLKPSQGFSPEGVKKFHRAYGRASAYGVLR